MIILIFCLSVFAGGKKNPVLVDVGSPNPVPESGQSEELSKTNYTFKCKSCTESEKRRIKDVEGLFQKLIESTCHIDAWKSFSRIDQTGGLTGVEISKKISSSSIKDIPIVFYWPTFFQSKNVIGYTYPSSPEIYLNRSFRLSKSWTAWSELSNLYHEVTHKLGFEHDFKATERRPYSVPYRGNRVVEACEKKI